MTTPKNPKNPKKPDELREIFFSRLLRKASTRKQAEEFLSRFQLPVELHDSLMNEAEETGLIDDLAYARLFADGHSSWGNAKISYELSLRGISRENVRLALEDIADESERAGRIAEELKKTGLDERKIKSRLISRGFSAPSLFSKGVKFQRIT